MEKFTHTQNKMVFLSRSVAVVGVIFAYTNEGIKVLITQRSKHMMDEKLKFCVPCGYLDYDENCWNAMFREVFEETSLYLPDFKDQVIFDNNKQPFKIKDEPLEDKRQNVSMLYTMFLNFKDSDNFPSYVEKYTCREVKKVFWMNYSDFIENKDMQWAFNHDETIKQAFKFITKNN